MLLADARPVPLPAPVMARVSRLVLALQAGDRRRIGWSTAAVCAATLLLVVLARERSTTVRDWILATVLFFAAAGLVVLTRRVSLSIAAGVSGRAGSIEWALGWHCVALESASACAVMGAGWLAMRRRFFTIGQGSVIGTEAAGALAGDAALHLTCRAHASLPHLPLFHLGGIVLAAMLARAIWRTRSALKPASG